MSSNKKHKLLPPHSFSLLLELVHSNYFLSAYHNSNVDSSLCSRKAPENLSFSFILSGSPHSTQMITFMLWISDSPARSIRVLRGCHRYVRHINLFSSSHWACLCRHKTEKILTHPKELLWTNPACKSKLADLTEAQFFTIVMSLISHRRRSHKLQIGSWSQPWQKRFKIRK